MIATYDPDFDRINRHRALAEAVIHNRNWLPSWLLVPVVSDFCEQGERYLRGEGLPPIPVRLWWAYRHWRFRRGVQKRVRSDLREHHQRKNLYAMQTSKITGETFKAGGLIRVAPGQRVECIPVMQDDSHEISVTDMKTGKRRTVKIDNEMLRNIAHPRWHEYLPDVPPEMRKTVWFSEDGDFEIDCTTVQDLKRKVIAVGGGGCGGSSGPGAGGACGMAFSGGGGGGAATNTINFNGMPSQSVPIPKGIGDYPRPDCPKCHTPGPELGTPLNDRTASGWGDSFYTCSNHNCRHTWKWKKVYPGLEENNNREGTKTGAKLKGTDTPFHLISQAGLTVEQVNEAVKRFANVAAITKMSPSQQVEMAKIVQAHHQKTCNEEASSLATITPSRKPGDRSATII